jgi:hypothetical protein
MLSKRLLDDHGLGLALAARLRPCGDDDVLVELDGQGLLGHVFMVPETRNSTRAAPRRRGGLWVHLALVVVAPALTGDRPFDAWLAGLVE